jgi:hypothetical protein
MKYNPAVPMHERYRAVPDEPISTERREKLEGDVIALCRALGYDMNTVEFATRDGVDYAIDFMNPAPDADYNSVGHANFEWVVTNTAEMLVHRATEDRPPVLPSAPAKLSADYLRLESGDGGE